MKKIIWEGENIIYENQEMYLLQRAIWFFISLGLKKHKEYEVSTEYLENSKEIVVSYNGYSSLCNLSNPDSDRTGYVCKDSLEKIFGNNIKSLYYRKL